MSKVTPTSSRKSDHIRINIEEDVRSSQTTGLERYRFNHQALPEIDYDDVDLSTQLFNRQLFAPILISSMTGGTEHSGKINTTLALAAQQTGIAMGLGSQRAAIEQPDLESTFQVRQVAPDILLFANLGAVQLNYGYGVEECQKAVDMVQADGLILHLNPLQEALQPEGETRFAGLLDKIETVCNKLTVPVIIKEVGWGFTGRSAQELANAGVAAIDISGAGGTSWSQVEMHRAEDKSQARIAATFIGWGIPTVDSLIEVRNTLPDLPIFASGGLRNGLDIAKCIALGATLGGMAGPFIKAAVDSTEAVIETIETVKRELRVCMFAAGAVNIQALQSTKLVNS